LASLADDEIARRIAAAPVAHLATVGAERQPHVVPIVFAVHGNRLWSPIDGKPKRSNALRRIANVRTNPRVSVLIDRYDDDWTALWWIRIDGDARIVAGSDLTIAELESIERALRGKYPQYRAVPLFRDSPLLLCVTPRTTRGWSADPG
jgi:PPOX class probable F420-dependent enzyme